MTVYPTSKDELRKIQQQQKQAKDEREREKDELCWDVFEHWNKMHLPSLLMCNVFFLLSHICIKYTCMYIGMCFELRVGTQKISVVRNSDVVGCAASQISCHAKIYRAERKCCSCTPWNVWHAESWWLRWCLDYISSELCTYDKWK